MRLNELNRMQPGTIIKDCLHIKFQESTFEKNIIINRIEIFFQHVHKQISLLTSANQPVEVQQREEQERVVYVAYDVDDADSPSFHILDPEQAESLDESKVVSTLYSEESLLTSRADPVPVTDEQGNPLHFTMQDGTRLAITSSDGKTLQVVTEDGQTIPVEINGFAEDEELQSQDTIVHQLDLHKSVAAAEPVTHFFTIV